MVERNRPRQDDAAAVAAEFAARMLRASFSFLFSVMRFIVLFLAAFIHSLYVSIANSHVDSPLAEGNDCCLRTDETSGKSY